MKFEVGMLCYIAVHADMKKTLGGRFCTIHLKGHDDLCPPFNDGRYVRPWFALFSRPFEDEDGKVIRGCYVCASILRPVSGPSAALIEEPAAPELVA